MITKKVLKTSLTTLLMSASLLASTTSADNLKSLENQLNTAQDTVTTLQKKIDDQSIWDHIVNFITGDSPDEDLRKAKLKVKQLEEDLSEERLNQNQSRLSKNRALENTADQVLKLNNESLSKTEEKKKKLEEAKKAEEAKKLEEARKAEEDAKKSSSSSSSSSSPTSSNSQTTTQSTSTPTTQATSENNTATPASTPTNHDPVSYDTNGLLKMIASDQAQKVVNHLLGPGTGFVTHTSQMDADIDSLSTEEAIWVLHRIEGPGFGQVASGYAGVDSNASHSTFVEQQLNRRFNGSIHELLKAWGTFSYSGY